MENFFVETKTVCGTLDPFKVLHEDLFSFIFQHLRGRLIMQLFKVSKQWNIIASKSATAMRTIELVYKESINEELKPEVMILVQSGRLYQNLNVEMRHRANHGLRLPLLEKFSQSLVELKIDVRPLTYTQLEPDTSFPKLKTLIVENLIPINLKTEIIEASPLFERLATNVDSTNEHLFEVILEKSLLKELELSGDCNSFFNRYSFANAKFELTSLSIKYHEARLNPKARVNFNNLLLQMSKTLEILFIRDCYRDDIEIMLNRLPALKVFESFEVHPSGGVQLKSNHSIKKLKCLSVSAFPKEVLARFKGLEVLQVKVINDKEFEWIAQNMRSLKNLCFEIWRKYDGLVQYETSFEGQINKDIKIVFSEY